jgi:hypothetical protein
MSSQKSGRNQLQRLRVIAIALALVLLQIVAAGNIAFAAAVTVTANPSTINLCGTGNSSALAGTTTFSGDVFNSGSITFDSTFLGITNIAGTGTATETATATATGTKTGQTNVTFTDNKGHAGSATITVVDRLAASPTTLPTFTGSQPQSFTLTNPCGGTIASMTYDTSAMTVTGCPSGTALSSTAVTCTVTPKNATSNSNIVTTDSFGGTATVTVNINSGPLTLSPASGSSLTTFVATGNGGALSSTPATDTFTAQETNFTGTFTPSVTTTSGTSPVVSVSPSTATGPGPDTFTVTPQNYGKGTVNVTDGHATGTLNVVVSGGTISINNSSISFGTVTDNTQQFLAASTVTVMGSLMSVNSGSQIAVLSPSLTNGAITGTRGGQMPLAALTYSCTGTINANRNQGATFAPNKETFVNNALASPCVSFASNSFSNMNFTLSVFLDDRNIPADTYTGNGFQLVLSAN